jgi:hypothetical protein
MWCLMATVNITAQHGIAREAERRQRRQRRHQDGTSALTQLFAGVQPGKAEGSTLLPEGLRFLEQDDIRQDVVLKRR